MSSCCPPNSWPSLEVNYEAKGKYIDLNGVSLYISGEPSAKAVLVIPDIFGTDSGRTKAIVDHLALEGYYTVLPDILRGEFVETLDGVKDWGMLHDYSSFQEDVRAVVGYMVEQGATSIGLIGFCWGCWTIFHMTSDESLDQSLFKGSVNCHPSLAIEQMIYERDPLELAKRVIGTPALLLAAGNDPEYVKAGGAVVEILREKDFGSACDAVTFENQQHGWVNRGDLNDESTAKAVKEALTLALSFFETNL